LHQASRCSFSGPLDTAVPGDAGQNVLVALREALSNAARHAGASQVDISVDADRYLVLVVRDNGSGIGETTRRSGLANLEQRANALGGHLHVGPRDGGGTDLRWQVPLFRSH
jgi:signal transduction histidine kinase